MYFELDLDGQLNEYQDRKAMGSTVLALSIGEVPEGRQRTPYLVGVDTVFYLFLPNALSIGRWLRRSDSSYHLLGP